jgi:hypothetical protein
MQERKPLWSLVDPLLASKGTGRHASVVLCCGLAVFVGLRRSVHQPKGFEG